MRRIFLMIVGIVFMAALPAQAKLLAAVSIGPEAYFLKQVGGDRVQTLVMVPPGADPHTYEPKPKQLAQLSKAAVYFAVGMDFEGPWLPRFAAANPKMTIVHTDAGIAKMPMVAHHHGGAPASATSGAKAETPQAAGEPDPHVWLSPALAKRLAASMRDALTRLDPAGTATYAAGYTRFAAACDKLDANIKKLFADLPPGKHVFLVLHPAWGYFAREYGLTQVPIEQLGREPGPKTLAAIIAEAKEHGAKVVFIQPGWSPAEATTVAKAIGGSVAGLDPLAENWPQGLRTAAQAIHRGLVSGNTGKK